MEIRTVNELPPTVRGAGTKNAEERAKIEELLLDGQAHIVTGVKDKKAHAALQQRIRGVAKKHNVKVTIKYYAQLQETGFQIVSDGEADAKKDSDKPAAKATRSSK